MKDTPAYFIVGTKAGQHLGIRPYQRTHPASDDYWDGNWLTSAIRIRAGGFEGDINACLRAEDFPSFRKQLASIYKTLRGKATFHTMEEWVSIVVEGDGLGHFQARCTAMDTLGTGNRLTFYLSFDQTDIPKMIRDLKGIEKAFPVLGSPDA